MQIFAELVPSVVSSKRP